MRTFTVFAASHDALGAAETDFQAVHEFYMAGVLSAEEFEKAKSRLLGE